MANQRDSLLTYKYISDRNNSSLGVYLIKLTSTVAFNGGFELATNEDIGNLDDWLFKPENMRYVTISFRFNTEGVNGTNEHLPILRTPIANPFDGNFLFGGKRQVHVNKQGEQVLREGIIQQAFGETRPFLLFGMISESGLG